MYTHWIRRFTILAALAAAPATGLADGAPGAGQAQGGNSQGGKAAAATEGQQGQGAPAAGQMVVPATIFMLVPVAVATKDNAMKSGCWARIYSGKNYSGDTLTLAGPLDIADMSGPFGLNWDDKVDSVEIGPKATLTVFDNQKFADQVAQFKPGQRVPDISKPLGFFDEFASVRLSCAKA
ncbi:beta/gamma crystallin domain-containing protein [Massilia pseudoviolaceinigra]|uniref:beta/gamma crystallin domain-containing protein n=1 Tax=Massilia pseudoviolaceinigra TaxID=3057165 RepID=UPI00279654EB|nr:beta/gamma crystallin domain-containing protein [Massilia sp. CCM 9206]MDQ1921561.1 beta/gamma crystallin domain-containing protein [Massilia sp. CCM 9206]